MFQTTNQISYLIIVDLFLSIWLQLHGYSSGISLSRSAWLMTGGNLNISPKKTLPLGIFSTISASQLQNHWRDGGSLAGSLAR